MDKFASAQKNVSFNLNLKLRFINSLNTQYIVTFKDIDKTLFLIAQIPMCDARSDGSDNFIGSLIFAGNYTIPEVTIYFCNKLMRGNRTIKFSSNNLDPFTSPNAREIARMGTDIIGKFYVCLCKI